MKKHIIVFGLLTVLLITTLLAGCGGGGGGTSTTTPGGVTTSPGGATTSPGGTTTSPVTTTTTVTTGDNLENIISQAASFPTVYYEMVSTISGTMTMTVKYWMKNRKVRAEMSDTGIITLMNMDTHTMYMYTPATNTAVKMVYDASQVPGNPNQILDYTPNVVGTETIDGKVCTIIEYNYGQASVKTWIWNDKGYPVRMETTSNGVTSVVEWRNFNFSDIDDSMFELPEGVEIIDMGG
jgi:outer membrane lipoprotein-sorting protein